MALIEVNAKLSHEARILSVDGEGNYKSAEIDYIVKFGNVTDGSDLEEYAINAVRAEAPATLHLVPLDSISIKERLAPTAFVVTASYATKDGEGAKDPSDSGSGGGGNNNNDDESEAEMTFECSTETKHVSVAYSQSAVSMVDGSTAKWDSNLIKWNNKDGPDSEIEGCDTARGVAVETWTKRMRYSKITTQKKMRWAETVGCVNNGHWKGWPPRCAMFMGASFSKNTDDRYVLVSFHFQVGPPRETYTSGSKSIVVEKSPFDYVWPLQTFPKNQPPDTKALIIAVVTQTADFDVLGI